MKTQLFHKFRTTIVILLMVTSSSLFLQAQAGTFDGIKSMQVAFITNYLDLTSDEAEAFFPRYNDYQRERKEIKLKYKGKSDVSNDIDYQQELLNLKKTYMPLFAEVLPQEKLDKLPEAEKAFIRLLLEKAQNNN